MGGKSRDLDLYIIYKMYRNTKEMDGWLSATGGLEERKILNQLLDSLDSLVDLKARKKFSLSGEAGTFQKVAAQRHVRSTEQPRIPTRTSSLSRKLCRRAQDTREK